jgi:hypothetical protein
MRRSRQQPLLPWTAVRTAKRFLHYSISAILLSEESVLSLGQGTRSDRLSRVNRGTHAAPVGSAGARIVHRASKKRECRTLLFGICDQ